MLIICSAVANVLYFISLNLGVKKRLKEIMDLSLLKKSKRKRIKLSKVDAREKCEKLNNQRCDSLSSMFDQDGRRSFSRKLQLNSYLISFVSGG